MKLYLITASFLIAAALLLLVTPADGFSDVSAEEARLLVGGSDCKPGTFKVCSGDCPAVMMFSRSDSGAFTREWEGPGSLVKCDDSTTSCGWRWITSDKTCNGDVMPQPVN